MRVDTVRKLFAGVRIDGKMREQLDKCPPRDRVFFESADGKYLTVVRGGDDTFVGKVLDPAAPLNGIDDVRRNVWSILQRICPGRRDESEVKLFALDDSEVEPTFSNAQRPRGYTPQPNALGDRHPDRLPDRLGDRFGDRQFDRPIDRPLDRSLDRSGDRQLDRSLDRSGDKIGSPTRNSDEDDYY